MSENKIVLTRNDDSATALIRHERSTSKIRYANYVTDHGVTLENVPDHVQALANLAGEIRKWESAAERKGFCTKIRNGLKYHLTPAEEDSEETPAEGEGAEGEGAEGEGAEETPADPMADFKKALEKAVKAGLSKEQILAAVKSL